MFPRLPVLDSVERRFGQGPRSLQGFAVIGIQHLLETTGSLLESIIRLGVRAEDIYLGGKLYSTCEPVAAGIRALGINLPDPAPVPHWGGFAAHLEMLAESLWLRLLASGRGDIRRVLILDDGGFALKTAARMGRPSVAGMAGMAGIEQTTSGINSLLDTPPPFPVVDVATSAAKTLLESPLIERAVLRRVNGLNLQNRAKRVWGIAGMGNIGRALAAGLLSGGEAVCAFDVDQQAEFPGGIVRCRTMRDLFTESDVILGCAGEDLLLGKTWWQETSGEKILASCSSHDVEFRTILTAFAQTHSGLVSDPLATLTIKTRNGSIRLLRGGCPVNFDGSNESVPAAEIQLTRGLLLGGLLQAAKQLQEPSPSQFQRLMLSIDVQSHVAREWQRFLAPAMRPRPAITAQFADERRIAALSGGQGFTASPSAIPLPGLLFPPARSE